MQRFHYGVIAAALLAATSVAAAQQDKTQQNSADEALTRSAPEAKDPPQAPPQAKQNEASQPGTQQNGDAFVGGKLAVPGAPQGTQDEPAKTSAKNDQIDKTPIMAYPLALTDEQKRAIYQRLTQGAEPGRPEARSRSPTSPPSRRSRCRPRWRCRSCRLRWPPACPRSPITNSFGCRTRSWW